MLSKITQPDEASPPVTGQDSIRQSGSKFLSQTLREEFMGWDVFEFKVFAQKGKLCFMNLYFILTCIFPVPRLLII